MGEAGCEPGGTRGGGHRCNKKPLVPSGIRGGARRCEPQGVEPGISRRAAKVREFRCAWHRHCSPRPSPVKRAGP
ncbi:hypothetical protein FH609_015875 [Streptomyces sp. 3MP-14]|uniref:Uncharacterized protein n=1 Tax=Streptomyces mimosae TaxID=2586635 RepID=A0A5N6AAS2_9ACTN|nr:hypothetical protein FH607_013200 [Streptomyces mimosae]KAB8176313.1 hypothetical protein FH609_015875 [Streptomyces sp. 3MP-14]